MVVTTGVSTSRVKHSGTKSAWLWRRSNSPARSKACATWRISQTWASRSGSSEYPRGATPASAPVVCESRVANSVTSTPRATSASVSRLVTISHGP